MKAKCDVCNQDYEDKDPENDIFIQSGCQMICYDCINKQNKEFEKNKQNTQRTQFT